MKNKYDVVIAGASFAGLAAASKIKNRPVLLIDRRKPGANIKSACGTVLKTIEELGQEDCVLQIHDKIILHRGKRQFVYRLKHPFCVIEPKKFCQKLLKMGGADFWQATVKGAKNNLVKTDKGFVSAKILVDASGPGSVLTGRKNKHLSFGLETTVNHRAKGLHFWYEPKIFPQGIFWLFPQGKTSRVGIGSYRGRTNLLPPLKRFLRRQGFKMGKLHGGYFPHRMSEPVVGDVFRVGDAAGQCLAVTGEGIRPALIFGQKCGEIINRVLTRKKTLQEGLREYQEFLAPKRKYYKAMFWLQEFLIGIPEEVFSPLAWLASQKAVNDFILDHYLKIAEDNPK